MAILPLEHFDHDEVEQVMIDGRLRYEEALIALRLKDHIVQIEQKKPRVIVDRLSQKLEQMGNVSSEAEAKLMGDNKQRKRQKSRSLSPQECVLPSKRRRPSDGARRRATKPNKSAALKMSR